MDNDQMGSVRDGTPSSVTMEQLLEMEKMVAMKNERLIEEYKHIAENAKAENKRLRDHIRYIEGELGRTNKYLELIQTITQMPF